MSKAQLFNINEKCISVLANEDDEPYVVVRFPFHKSVTGFATICVKPEDIVPCELRGRLLNDRCNVILGNYDDTHLVRIPRAEQTETEDYDCDIVRLTSAEIIAIRRKSSDDYIKRKRHALSAIDKINDAMNSSQSYAETHPFDIHSTSNVSNTPSVSNASNASDTQNVSDTPNTQSVSSISSASSTIDLSNIINAPVTIKTNVIVKSDNKIVIETIIDRL